MLSKFLFLVFFLVYQVLGSSTIDKEKSAVATRLRKEIFTNYDKHTIPENITEEDRSEIIVHGWTRLTWMEHRLHWDPEEYGGLTHLNTPADLVWKPDLLLYNNLDTERDHSFQETMILNYNNGKILWVPRTIFYGHCSYDLRHWPFDEQSCMLKLGSWTHNGFYMDLELDKGEESAEIADLMGDTDWDITGTSSEKENKIYPCCEEPYPNVQFTIHMKRHSYFHSATVMVPAYALTALVLLSFWLHPSTSERLILLLSNVFFSILYLQHLGNALPKHGSNAPYIVLFFRDSLVMIIFSLVLTVIYRRFLLGVNRSSEAPRLVQSVINSWVGTVFCLKEGNNKQVFSQSSQQNMATELDGGDIMVYEENNSRRSFNWFIIVVDRLVFILYVLVFIVFLCAFCT